jgi:hypothetical protein
MGSASILPEGREEEGEEKPNKNKTKTNQSSLIAGQEKGVGQRKKKKGSANMTTVHTYDDVDDLIFANPDDIITVSDR